MAQTRIIAAPTPNKAQKSRAAPVRTAYGKEQTASGALPAGNGQLRDQRSIEAKLVVQLIKHADRPGAENSSAKIAAQNLPGKEHEQN